MAIVAACLALCCHSKAIAENYPTREITTIVPFPAGGAADTLARYLAERMRPILGLPIITENVAGAAGSIGVGRAVRRLRAQHRNLDHAYADRWVL